MRTVIKPEYEDTWFAIPKVMVEGYMPTIGINALALYTILSCYQDQERRITMPLATIRDRVGMRGLKVITTLEYLKRMRLVNDIGIANNTQALELAFTPQLKIKRRK